MKNTFCGIDQVNQKSPRRIQKKQEKIGHPNLKSEGLPDCLNNIEINLNIE
jgi:hypothetical protein